MFLHEMCKCNRLLDKEELAKWFGVKPQTISNRLSRGEDLPPSIKFGGVRRWPEQKVHEWITNNLE